VNRLLIVVGIFLVLIWLAVTFISFGLPKVVCSAFMAVPPGFFSGTVNTLHNGFFYEVPNRNMPTAVFIFLFSAAFFIYFIITVKIGKGPASVKSLGIVILFSILFRLILLPSVAIHESDLYRYLWDGKSFKNGINPFKYAPAEVNSVKTETNHEIKRLKELRDKNPLYFERINHKGVPTIYPPVAQVVFAVSSFIKEDSILVLKSIFVFFDILALLLIILLLSYFKMNPSLAIIYGWSPLVLKEIANSGHYDSITIFLTLLSLYFIIRNKALAGTISLACASLTKFYPVVLLLLYIKRIKIGHLFVFTVGLIGIYVPFFIWGQVGMHNVFTGLGIYYEKWAYNGSLFVVVESVLNMLHLRIISDLFLSKLITGLIFVILLLYWTLKRSDEPLNLIKRTLFVLVALFLLNPVGEPWYFCWVIPFLCFFPYRSLLLLSWLLIFSYLSFAHDFGIMRAGSLQIPILNAIQYVPFFLFFIWEFVLRKSNASAYVTQQTDFGFDTGV
jgi:alpha-1,6-mannosyltransferase